ncbi:sodium-coupled monocarboxylate transporter 1-like [Rhipicephalus microplus]
MTIYGTLCVHMGSLTRVFLMVYSSITAPFVGLCLLAALFPFVHSKGAGVATVITVAFQLWHMTHVIRSKKTPPRMPVSLDYCPGNYTPGNTPANTSNVFHRRSKETFSLLDISPLWSSFFAILATIFIGVLVSAITGEIKQKKTQPTLCSDVLSQLWQRLSMSPEEDKHQVTLRTCEGSRKCMSQDEKLLTTNAEAEV